MSSRAISEERPSRERQRAAPAPEPEGVTRLLADIPAPVYRSVKHLCVERGISIKAYVLELLLAAGHPRGPLDERPPVRASART